MNRRTAALLLAAGLLLTGCTPDAVVDPTSGSFNDPGVCLPPMMCGTMIGAAVYPLNPFYLPYTSPGVLIVHHYVTAPARTRYVPVPVPAYRAPAPRTAAKPAAPVTKPRTTTVRPPAPRPAAPRISSGRR